MHSPLRLGPLILAAVLSLSSVDSAPGADSDFLLADGDTVVFFGDSITQSGRYVEYIEAFLVTRFPGRSFRVINAGISSETISGTTETDHTPPRPHAHDRFVRDVAVHDPRVVVSCFGMNDGNYHPFDEERFRKFREGVELLIARVRQSTRATLVMATPPPFDPYRRRVDDPEATEYGYKFPAVDYDETLERYSEWLLGLRHRRLLVADLHGALNAHLTRRREEKVSFYLSGDGVHPNATGHWLMAQTILEAWNAPPACAEVVLDVQRRAAIAGAVRDVEISAAGVARAVWTSPLPMPLDPAWDARSIELEDVSGRLNRYRLQVIGLPVARYSLLADGTGIGEFTRDRLEKGLDLTTVPAFPTVAAGREVLELVQKRQRLVYRSWRESLKSSDTENALEEAETAAAEIDEQIRALCRPREIEIRLAPVADD